MHPLTQTRCSHAKKTSSSGHTTAMGCHYFTEEGLQYVTRTWPVIVQTSRASAEASHNPCCFQGDRVCLRCVNPPDQSWLEMQDRQPRTQPTESEAAFS